jgi:hypothetical protein
MSVVPDYSLLGILLLTIAGDERRGGSSLIFSY